MQDVDQTPPAHADPNESGLPTATIAMRWFALLIATLVVSMAFFGMIRPFLIPLVLAAIMAAISQPLYKRVLAVLTNRTNLSSAVTLTILMVAVIVPLLWIVALAGEQAAGFSESLVAALNELQSAELPDETPDWLPFDWKLGEMGPQIAEKVGDLAASAAGILVSSVAGLTRGTAAFFLDFFVFIYSMFFFLQMRTTIMLQVLSYSGLKPSTQRLLVERVVSVSRATIKGTLLIGVAQGVLGGVGFWAAGIDGAAFWGVVMAVLSVIPGLGPTAVIFCGVVYLVIQGDFTPAIGLGVWGAAVVGTVDNVLRPILVGRDAKMHDIMILVSTLGGLVAFGASGLVLGPVLAGLFVTIWTMLAEAAGGQIADGDEDACSEPDAPADATPHASDSDLTLDLPDELAAHVDSLRNKPESDA